MSKIKISRQLIFSQSVGPQKKIIQYLLKKII